MAQYYVLAVCMIVPIVSEFCAAAIAEQKRAMGFGALLGVLFGPLGVIAAGLIDARPRCPRCGGRLDLRVSPGGSLAGGLGAARGTLMPYPVCLHCGIELNHRKGEIFVTIEPSPQEASVAAEV